MANVKVLIIPVLRRYWLFHAWKEVAAELQVPKPWQQGADVREKATLLFSKLQTKAVGTFQKQWRKLETASEGTMNNKLFRFAQNVSSRVDPSETFLKALPQQASNLQIVYPASIPERLVRRRLRLLAAKAEPFHRSRLRVWAAALMPQLPLIPLPLPNVTIYYTVWRIVSNHSARKGASALAAALQLFSEAQRAQLARQLAELQKSGVQLKPGSWAEELAAQADRLQQLLDHTLADIQAASSGDSSSSDTKQWHQQQRRQDNQVKRLPLPQFLQDAQLDRLVQPRQRLTSPLPEAAVEQLVELYKQKHLLEHYRAANRKCLGDKQPVMQQQQQPHKAQQQPAASRTSGHQQQAGSSKAAADIMPAIQRPTTPQGRASQQL